MTDWPRFMNNYTASGWQSVSSLPTSIIRFISLSYLGHILFCCTPLVFCFFTFCFSLSLSLLSYYLACLSLCPLVSFLFLFPSLCSPYLFFPSVFLSCLHPHAAPPCSPPGFFFWLSWLSTLRKLKSWYICYKSIVSHWARRWVQSEPHSITQISHRAGALATRRRPDSRSAGALISRTCFSCNIRAVSRSSRGGVEAGQVLAAQSHSTTEQNKTTRLFHKKASSHSRGGRRRHDYFHFFYLFFFVGSSLMLWVQWWNKLKVLGQRHQTPGGTITVSGRLRSFNLRWLGMPLKCTLSAATQ